MSALVRWLPELAVATADDIVNYGPNAVRVRTLLDFLPKMSDDAMRVGGNALDAQLQPGALRDARNAAAEDAWDAVSLAENPERWNSLDVARNDAYIVAGRAVMDAARNAAKPVNMRHTRPAMVAAGNAAQEATLGELVADLISPENYRLLTNPLAAGRAVDVLAPRYKDTQFRELLQELAPKRVITQPSDVLGIGRIARSPEDIREIALTLIEDGGMTAEEAYNAARMLA